MNLTSLLEEQKKEAQAKLNGWIINVLEHDIERDYIRRELDTLLTTAMTLAYKLALEDVEKLKKSYWNGHGEGIMVIYPEDVAQLKETKI